MIDAETHYEPRVLWDVRGQASSLVGVTPRIQFDRQNLRNVERCPIQLTHMLVSPLDYAFEAISGIYDDDFTTAELFHQTREMILNDLRLSIMMPGRQYFTPDFTTLSTLGAIAAWGPATAPLGQAQLTANAVPAVRTSSPVNTLRWDFPVPIDITDWTRYEFALSSMTLPSSWDTMNGGAALAAPSVYAWISFFEEACDDPDANFFGGQMVSSDRLALTLARRSPFENVVDSANGGPASLSNSLSGERWPGGSRHVADALARSGRSKLRGFAVSLDQYAYDRAFQDNLVTAADADFIIASIASRLATKAHFVGAGTQRKLWRDGCPLDLVCPSATPAMVVPFDQPITLMPGDSLDVMAEMRAFGGQSQIFANLGISFTGHLTQPKQK